MDTGINRHKSKDRLTIKSIEAAYPSRTLPSKAKVTRIAPSPTGFAHLGFIYMSLISKQIAIDTDGVFIFRLEDTDQNREVEGADVLLRDALEVFGIEYDEGVESNGMSKGKYGPYRQTERVRIYQAYVEDLISKGLAYRCFMSAEELNAVRARQVESAVRPGIYREFSKWRNASSDEAQKLLDQGMPFVARFKWPDEQKEITHYDLSGTTYRFNSYDTAEDFVLIKSNGIPTYHLAHLIDDHLMKVNLVIRGNEWVSSIPKHVLLHHALEIESPDYYHIPPIEIIDSKTGGRRKISKRKDPEADVFKLLEVGYPVQALRAYLFRLVTSKYEDMALKMGTPTVANFELQIDMLKQGGGALYDPEKLDNLSSNVIAFMSITELANEIYRWCSRYDLNLHEIISKYGVNYLQSCLSVENNPEKKRKSITKFSEIPSKLGLFFDEIFNTWDYDTSSVDHIPQEVIINILREFQVIYSSSDTPEMFVLKLKEIAKNSGFALTKSDLKSNPELLGLWADIPAVIRIALAKKNMSPDLLECIKVIGEDRLSQRISDFIKSFKQKRAKAHQSN